MADKKDIQTKLILKAAERNRLFEVVYLLNDDPSLVEATDSDNYTPLHRASYANSKDCLKYLLKRGADIEAKTKDDWTPLHCAVRWNNLEIVEILVAKGANINAVSSGGNTPLHIAASNGPYSVTCDMIQLLLYHPECNFSLRNKSGDLAYDIAKRNGPFYRFWLGVTTILPEVNDDTRDKTEPNKCEDQFSGGDKNTAD